MHNYFMRALAIISVMAILGISAAAQDTASNTSMSDTPGPSTSTATSPVPQGGDEEFTLENGENEWGFWSGGAFKATTVFGGLTDAEASNRRMAIFAFRYGRTLHANNTLAVQYTLDAIPLAVARGNIRSVTTTGGVTTFERDTAYGFGVTPLGLQVDFANGSRVHPFVHLNGGLLIFNQSMPLPDAGKLALVGETGGGVRIFTSPRRALTVGVRFHHISNGDRSGSNRGLNQFVIYGGFSFFR